MDCVKTQRRRVKQTTGRDRPRHRSGGSVHVRKRQVVVDHRYHRFILFLLPPPPRASLCGVQRCSPEFERYYRIFPKSPQTDTRCVRISYFSFLEMSVLPPLLRSPWLRRTLARDHQTPNPRGHSLLRDLHTLKIPATHVASPLRPGLAPPGAHSKFKSPNLLGWYLSSEFFRSLPPVPLVPAQHHSLNVVFVEECCRSGFVQ